MIGTMKISASEWLEELRRVEMDKPQAGYITTQALSEKLRRSETTARKIIKKGIAQGLLEARPIIAPDMNGKNAGVIAYFPVAKKKGKN